MSNTTVYRLEHVREDSLGIGYGPYVSSMYHNARELCKAHNNSDHPNVYDDTQIGYARWEEWYYCACKSLEDVRIWFEEWLEPILDSGFEVVEYVVPTEDVLMGEKQCAFNGNNFISKNIVTDLVVKI